MGSRLVGAALAHTWATLTPAARLTLIAMCHTAHDQSSSKTEAGVYWAGRDGLILTVLGLDPATLTGAEHAAAAQRIKRYVAELVDAGAIVRLSEGRRGVAARYKVTPWGLQSALPLDDDGESGAGS